MNWCYPFGQVYDNSTTGWCNYAAINYGQNVLIRSNLDFFQKSEG